MSERKKERKRERKKEREKHGTVGYEQQSSFGVRECVLVRFQVCTCVCVCVCVHMCMQHDKGGKLTSPTIPPPLKPLNDTARCGCRTR